MQYNAVSTCCYRKHSGKYLNHKTILQYCYHLSIVKSLQNIAIKRGKESKNRTSEITIILSLKILFFYFLVFKQRLQKHIKVVTFLFRIAYMHLTNVLRVQTVCMNDKCFRILEDVECMLCVLFCRDAQCVKSFKIVTGTLLYHNLVG